MCVISVGLNVAWHKLLHNHQVTKYNQGTWQIHHFPIQLSAASTHYTKLYKYFIAYVSKFAHNIYNFES